MGYCSHLSTCPSQLLNDRDETERQLLHLTQALGSLPLLAWPRQFGVLRFCFGVKFWELKIHRRATARPQTPEAKLKREEEKEGGKRCWKRIFWNEMK